MYGIIVAYVDAVEAVDTPRTVHGVRCQVYTLRFAHVFAFAALCAAVGIDVYAHHRIAADIS